MLPILASDALRQLSPRKLVGTSFFSGNRFSTLRDQSPALSGRDRSVSQKRKVSNGNSYAAVAGSSAPLPTSLVPDMSELINNSNIGIAKVKSVIDSVSAEVTASSSLESQQKI